MSLSCNSFFSEVYKDLTGNDSNKNIDHFLNELCKLFVRFEANDVEPPSSCVLAMTANCGATFAQSASSALNCVTDKHLLFSRISDFIEDNWKKDPKLVAETSRIKGKKIPGFGHPSIKGEDERVLKIISLAKELKFDCPRLLFVEQLSLELKPYLNVGGATSAALLDLGFNRDNVVYFPIISRMFGWLKIYLALDKQKDSLLPSDIFIEKYKEIFSKK